MKPIQQAPAGFPHKECQEDFVEERAKHYESMKEQEEDKAEYVPQHLFNGA